MAAVTASATRPPPRSRAIRVSTPRPSALGRTQRVPAAEAKGRLRGKQPKLTSAQEAHLVELHRAGTYTSAELAELFSVARSTVYRAIQRAAVREPAA